MYLFISSCERLNGCKHDPLLSADYFFWDVIRTFVVRGFVGDVKMIRLSLVCSLKICLYVGAGSGDGLALAVHDCRSDDTLYRRRKPSRVHFLHFWSAICPAHDNLMQLLNSKFTL